LINFVISVFQLVWFFGYTLFLMWSLVSTVIIQAVLNFICQEESKIGGSLVCVITLCRFLNLPITDGGMKRWGFRGHFTIKVQRTLMREQKFE